jgi:uncharacterized protein YggE
MPEIKTSEPLHKIKLSIKLDFRWIALFLMMVIIGMLVVWKPWESTNYNESRVVSVTGEATISAEPDEYVFYPSYEFKNIDRQIAINESSAKSAEIVAKLKELGVADSKIKTSVSGYQNYYYSEADGLYYYTLSITVNISDLTLAQSVQDYLITTGPQGNISPVADFSDDKQNTLETQARDEATKDARSKADQMAANLGFKLGKVKSVTDGSGFGGIEPMYALDSVKSSTSGEDATTANTIQPGENELSYSVTVVYYLK